MNNLTKEQINTTHELKLRIELCDAVLKGEKNFEVRFNDRGYQKFDLIKFCPVDWTERNVLHEISNKLYEITYVLSGWGLQDGWVAFGIREVGLFSRRKTDEDKP